MEDVKTLRKMAAENTSLKAECAELRAQLDGWKTSAGNWQKLYESEKQRADNVQGEVINNLEKAIKNKDSAIDLQRQQIQSDKDYISSLEGKVRSLKKQRWKIGAIAFTFGNAAGSYIGYKIGKLNI